MGVVARVLGVRSAMADERGVMVRAGLEPEPMLRTAKQERRRDQGDGEAMECGRSHGQPVRAEELTTIRHARGPECQQVGRCLPVS